MHNIAILGFFSIVILFFFTGRDDFGLKPTPRKFVATESNVEDELNLEELEK